MMACTLSKTTASGHLSALVVTTLVLVCLTAGPSHCYYNESLFKSIVYHDRSNDDATYLGTEELINRSGFRYEEYYAVADDGYITQILRVINPKADRKHLKYPPVLMMHGSHLDTSIYVISSSIQHHPEPWPRKPTDGPMHSWNRSLAFMLANNGYDVFLIGTRGSNNRNSYYTLQPKKYQAQQPHFKPDISMLIYAYTPFYWDHGLDNIIQYEIYNQIDLILNVTGAREFHLLSFSLSTMSTMAFLAENPKYAHKTRVYTQLAPVMAASHFTSIARIYWEKIAPYLPSIGIGFSPSFFMDDVVLKQLVLLLAKSPKLRYSILYEVASTMFGPSPRYSTWLEMNVINKLIMPVSYKSAQSYAQASKDVKFHKFDYGPLRNLLHYNRTKPPEHKVDKLEVQNYLIISGAMDSLGDPVTVQRLKELTITPKPIDHILCDGCNHIDLIANVEVAKYVTLPYLDYLNKHSDWTEPGVAPVGKQAKVRVGISMKGDGADPAASGGKAPTVAAAVAAPAPAPAPAGEVGELVRSLARTLVLRACPSSLFRARLLSKAWLRSCHPPPARSIPLNSSRRRGGAASHICMDGRDGGMDKIRV